MSTNENALNFPELPKADETRAPRRRLAALIAVHVLVAGALMVLPFQFAIYARSDEDKVAMLSAGVCLPLGLIFALTGRGMVGRRAWARRVSIWLHASLFAISLIAAISIVLYLVLNPLRGRGFGGLAAAGAFIVLASSVAVLLIHGAAWFVALLFLRQPSVRAMFSDGRHIQWTLLNISLIVLFSAAYGGGVLLSSEWHRADIELQAMGLFDAPGSQVLSPQARAGFDNAAFRRASRRIHQQFPERLNLSQTRITDDGLDCLKNLSEVGELDLSETQVTDAGMNHLAALPKLWNLHLNDTAITDLGLANLKNLPSLRNLDLSGTQVTDAGLKHVAAMSNLWSLNLNKTAISDLGLANLKDLPALRDLDLSGTEVTDAGLGHVAALASLWRLNLSRTRITDEGLKQLKGAQALTYLFVSGTSVSQAGAADLFRALPGLRQINRSDTLLDTTPPGRAAKQRD